jgi:hypothetical protein
MADQGFSIQPTSLLDFANELQTQIEGISAPMNALATQAGSKPQFGGFAEAQTFSASQATALEEMHSLLGQVKEAIGFVQSVTTAVAHDYQQADQDAAASFGAPGYQEG